MSAATIWAIAFAGVSALLVLAEVEIDRLRAANDRLSGRTRGAAGQGREASR